MAELTTYARPYARAAFEYAREAERLAEWAKSLSLVAALSQDPKVAGTLTAPSLTSDQKKAILVALCGDDIDENFKNFVAVLASNKRIALLPQVMSLFADYKANFEKTAEVVVSSAFDISPQVQTGLAKALQKKLERNISLSTEIDSTLLGGAVIRVGDTVVDGSLKGRLAKLAEAMGI